MPRPHSATDRAPRHLRARPRPAPHSPARPHLGRRRRTTGSSRQRPGVWPDRGRPPEVSASGPPSPEERLRLGRGPAWPRPGSPAGSVPRRQGDPGPGAGGLSCPRRRAGRTRREGRPARRRWDRGPGRSASAARWPAPAAPRRPRAPGARRLGRPAEATGWLLGRRVRLRPPDGRPPGPAAPRSRQRPARLEMEGLTYREGEIRVHGLTDQFVMKGQALAGLAQYPGPEGLLEAVDQRRARPVEDRGEVGQRERRAEDRGDAQHLDRFHREGLQLTEDEQPE